MKQFEFCHRGRLTFASASGTFGTINDPSGTTLTPTYNSTNLTLEVALLSSPETLADPSQEVDPDQATLLAGLLGTRQREARPSTTNDTSDATPRPGDLEAAGIMTVSALVLELPADRGTDKDVVFIELAKRD